MTPSGPRAPSILPPMRPEIFLDLETTGIDPGKHEITELAILDIEGNVLLHALVTVERMEDADPEALALHGYDAERWRASSRPWSEVAHLAKKCFDTDPLPVLVGHFVEFDRRFLECGFADVGIDPGLVPHRVVDTHALAHEHLVDVLTWRTLAHIAKILDLAPRGALHRASEDADLARRVYLRLCRADEQQRETWRKRALSLESTP